MGGPGGGGHEVAVHDGIAERGVRLDPTPAGPDRVGFERRVSRQSFSFDHARRD